MKNSWRNIIYHVRAHETGEAAKGTVVSDYHPLEKEEVASLLFDALEEYQKGGTAAFQQVRLAQAIPGITCPRNPSTSPSGGRYLRLNDAFMEFLESKGDALETAQEIEGLIFD